MFKQLVTVAVAAMTTSAALADTAYGFDAVTNNDAKNVAIGEAQFSVEIKEAGNLVEFLFRNTGPEALNIVSIYWEDDADEPGSIQLLSTTTPEDVDFSESTDPTLPADYGVFANITDADLKGTIGPNEDLSVFVTNGPRYDAILNRIPDQSLSLNVEAVSPATGETETFTLSDEAGLQEIKVTPSPTAGLAGLALMGLLAGRRRRRG